MFCLYNKKAPGTGYSFARYMHAFMEKEKKKKIRLED